MEDHSHEFAVTGSIITDRSTKHEPLASACTESFLENTDTTFKLELTRVSDIGKIKSKRVLESEKDEAVTTCKHDARKRKSGMCFRVHMVTPLKEFINAAFVIRHLKDFLDSSVTVLFTVMKGLLSVVCVARGLRRHAN